MINLSPIHRKVRETLANRAKALKRDFSGGDPLEPVEQIQKTYSRSIWVKMYSPVKVGKVDGARIFGGEVFKDESSRYYPVQGFGQTYGKLRSSALEPQSDDYQTDLLRPVPGIKDFSCEYKGGMSAIREAQINFIVWSFDDLERLTPFFMSAGKGVLLEWGYGSVDNTSLETVSEEDVINGKVYTKINQIVLENGGVYDGMAGVISNFEWKVRSDGGFDVTTTIVSRGVNIINTNLDQSDAPLAASTDGEPEKIEAWPTLGEFCAALEIELYAMATAESSWSDFQKSLPPASVTDTKHRRGETLPPGVLVYATNGWISRAQKAGPYVTWGFLEDNILSKWVSRYAKGDKRITSSFRSISPVINSSTGRFIDENTGEDTDNIEVAKMESVKISNHPLLFTPHKSRWILPGQFPVEDIPDDAAFFSTDGDEEFLRALGGLVNNPNNYEPFKVTEGEGYLRNILISFDLIQKSFTEVKTLKEGLQNLFDEINQDVQNLWGFEIVNDPYIPGNVKVIDSKSTFKSSEEYISQREPNPKNDMFIFDSWGEESIIKSQELTAKLPSAFQVTAMYAGTSPKDAGETEGDQDSQVYGKMAGADGFDQSQPDIVRPTRIDPDAPPFGSQNPYLYKGAGNFVTSETFGYGHGIPFNAVDFVEIIKRYTQNNEDGQKVVPNSKKKAQKTFKARTSVPIQNFFKAKDEGTLYDENGDLIDNPDEDILHKTVMGNVLSGNTQLLVDPNTGQLIDSSIPIEAIEKAQSDTDLYPVELSISIDGIGGIFPGNVFHINYIPKRFRDFCVFQIVTVNQSVSADNWTTDITGLLRVASNLITEKATYLLNDTIEAKDSTDSGSTSTEKPKEIPKSDSAQETPKTKKVELIPKYLEVRVNTTTDLFGNATYHAYIKQATTETPPRIITGQGTSNIGTEAALIKAEEHAQSQI